jgi:F0F1-type ATP synthase gamma subunit
MSTNLSAEINFVTNLRSLVFTYEEIAVMRIERVRRGVLAARQFRLGLSDVFSQVRTSHHREVAAELKKQSKGGNNKEVALLLSTNTRLAGPISSRVSRAFASFVSSNPMDVAIVGQIGKERFKEALPQRDFKFFSFSEGQPRSEDLHSLIAYLLDYKSVVIFFGHFENLINQAPAKIKFGEDEILTAPQASPRSFFAPSVVQTHIFEPSLKEVVQFFNDQIFATLVQLTFSESWLSLLGSRITAMEQASHRIGKELAILEWRQRREDRQYRNRKQRDRLSGLVLWHNV